MRLTNEMQLIKSWAVQYGQTQESCLSQISSDMETYWEEWKEPHETEDYDYNTVPELLRMLNAFWINEPETAKIARPLAIAAFKEREVLEKKQQKNENMEGIEKQLPDYVYIF